MKRALVVVLLLVGLALALDYAISRIAPEQARWFMSEPQERFGIY